MVWLPLWIPTYLMPKRPNLRSPVAATRARLNMSIEQFSDLVGHGAPMLKHIESGRKKISIEVAEKISNKTGIPVDLLLKRTLTASERQEIMECDFRVLRKNENAARCISSAMIHCHDLVTLFLMAYRKSPQSTDAVRTGLVVKTAQMMVDLGIDSDSYHKLKSELWDEREIEYAIMAEKIRNSEVLKGLFADSPGALDIRTVK